MAQNSDYEAIIMNVKMPVMDGYRATKKIRTMGYAKPILGHSSLHHLEAVRIAFKVGMSHYLLRTHHSDDLLGVLHHLNIIKASKNMSTQWNKDYFFTKNLS